MNNEVKKFAFKSFMILIALIVMYRFVGDIHIQGRCDDHEWTWYGQYSCPECPCWIHEDCYPLDYNDTNKVNAND